MFLMFLFGSPSDGSVASQMRSFRYGKNKGVQMTQKSAVYVEPVTSKSLIKLREYWRSSVEKTVLLLCLLLNAHNTQKFWLLLLISIMSTGFCFPFLAIVTMCSQIAYLFYRSDGFYMWSRIYGNQQKILFTLLSQEGKELSQFRWVG